MIYESGFYTFKVYVDDGFQIKIDNADFFNGWTSVNVRKWGIKGTKYLSAGKHDFFVDYLERALG
jgi:hypothetical protein